MNTIETTPLYIKKGRRYIPHRALYGDVRFDSLRIGQSMLITAATDGMRCYAYDVPMATAGWVAAAQVAKMAMVEAMRGKAVAVPAGPTKRPYTKRQREIIERFRAEMQAAGGLLPDFWTHTSAYDVAQAGIDAVDKVGQP